MTGKANHADLLHWIVEWELHHCHSTVVLSNHLRLHTVDEFKLEGSHGPVIARCEDLSNLKSWRRVSVAQQFVVSLNKGSVLG